MMGNHADRDTALCFINDNQLAEMDLWISKEGTLAPLCTRALLASAVEPSGMSSCKQGDNHQTLRPSWRTAAQTIAHERPALQG